MLRSLVLLITFSIAATNIPTASALMPEDLEPPSALEIRVQNMMQRRDERARARVERRKTLSQTSFAHVRYHAFSQKETFVFSRANRPQGDSINTKNETQTVTMNTEPAPLSPALNRLRTSVLTLVNDVRRDAHLAPLSFHALLNTSAQKYANYMAKDDFFSHTDPTGKSSLDRIRDTGYLRPPCDCSWQYTVGENLAKNQRTPQAVMQAWMESPDHRANILQPEFLEMGIGYANGYWVQHFGGIRAK